MVMSNTAPIVHVGMSRLDAPAKDVEGSHQVEQVDTRYGTAWFRMGHGSFGWQHGPFHYRPGGRD
ncbi:MAG: hypothetical protein OEW13_09925 [Nitrospira sp.]|nr:hypothetical protein [Nitrospira sp.]